MKKTILSMLLPLAALSAWAVSVTSTPGQLSQAVTDHSVTELTVAGAPRHPCPPQATGE